ncbi:hypothetical protein [Nonomuraea rubra]
MTEANGRPALLGAYRCCTCNGSGVDDDNQTCRDCTGTGIDNHTDD